MASSTKLSICSNALIKVGDKSITSLSDATTRADVCNRFYTKCLEAVLRAHPWKFGTARRQLAALVTTPVFGFTYQFQLPSDCLFVIETDLDKDEKWSVEGRTLVCNSASVSIKYIIKTTSDADMDSLFVEALETKLAFEIAIPITGQQSIQDRMEKQYADKLKEARTRDGLEQSQITYEYTGLLDVRY